jgi:hypothetical protein
MEETVNLTAISNAALYVKLTMIVCAAPLVAGILYGIRPNERWLALLRPLSLAAIFASVSNLLLGLVKALVYIGRTTPESSASPVPAAIVLAETVIPSFIGFACLTAAWLCVAVGVRRST